MNITWRIASPKSRCWRNKTKKHAQLSIPQKKFQMFLQTTCQTQTMPVRKPASSQGEKVSRMLVINWCKAESRSIFVPYKEWLSF
jgi:hypothetical protein